jgi:translocator protein
MNYSKLIAALAICYFVAFAGSLVTTPAIDGWYATLNKPSFNPPNWIFGPVWTLLYTMMGISLYIVWNKGIANKKDKKAVAAFFIQLFLNFMWSFVFFGLQLPLLAFVVILVLWGSIFYTIVLFKKRSTLAAYLLIPYLAWVSFASILNLFIVLLN